MPTSHPPSWSHGVKGFGTFRSQTWILQQKCIPWGWSPNTSSATVVRKHIGARDTGHFLYFYSFSYIALLHFEAFPKFLSTRFLIIAISDYRGGTCTRNRRSSFNDADKEKYRSTEGPLETWSSYNSYSYLTCCYAQALILDKLSVVRFFHF